MEVWLVYNCSSQEPPDAPLPAVIGEKFDAVDSAAGDFKCEGCADNCLGPVFYEDDDHPPRTSGIQWVAFWILYDMRRARALCEDCTVNAFGLPA